MYIFKFYLFLSDKKRNMTQKNYVTYSIDTIYLFIKLLIIENKARKLNNSVYWPFEKKKTKIQISFPLYL